MSIWLRLVLGVLISGAMVAGCTPSTSGKLSSADELLIREQIRDAITDYALLRDGDGIQPADAKRFTQQLFTADGVLEGYSPDKQLMFRWRMNGETGEISVLEGQSRTEIGKSAPPSPDGAPVVVYHYPVSVKFDKITATVVETRTTALVLFSTKNVEGPKCSLCASRPVNAIVSVYHDVWHRTAHGWRKHFSREYLLT